MRTRHWLAALMGGCMAIAGVGTASAQPPMMPGNGNPDQAGMGMPGGPYNNMYGPSQPYSSGMGVPGYPPGANPWPGISPFAGPPVDSTSYEDGFWFNRILQGNRKYYFSAEGLHGHTKHGNEALIGAPGVNQLSNSNLNGTLTTGVTGSATVLVGSTSFNQAISTVGPSRSATANGGGGGGGTATSAPNIFPSATTGVVSDSLGVGGFRSTWGWFNADDTGFVASGFYQTKSTRNYDLEDPFLYDPSTGNYNPFNLHAWFGLPLGSSGLGAVPNATVLGTGVITKLVKQDGDTDGNSLYGAVIPYDMGVHIAFSTQLSGGNADWYFNSVYEQSAIKVRPLAGARYVYLRENFSFDAYDSGLGYTIAATSANGGGGGGGGGGAGGTAGSGFLSPATFQAGFSSPNILHSHLSSTDVSQMGGPEAGFRVDFGGSKFQVSTHTKFGALANVTSRSISGYGIGNNFNIISPNTVPVMPNDPSKTAFSSSTTTTSMSPMFEQSINVKLPVFNLVPYLNKLEMFERAQVTAGYTFLYIGDIYRPQDTIIWNQYPKTPQLNNSRSDFQNSNFNLGIEWQY